VRHQLTAVIGQINLSDFEGHPDFPNLSRVDVATAGYEEALARLGRPPLLEDTSFGVVRFRGLVEERLARMLRVGGALEGALTRYQASLDVRSALFDEYPNDDDVWRDIGVTHQNLCSVHEGLERFDEAERACSEAIDVYRARFQADSLNVQTLSDLSSIHNSYQELFLNRGDTLQALGHLDLMAEWAQRRLARDPSSLPARQRHLDALLTRGLVLAGRGVPLRERDATFALVDALAAEGHLSDEDSERAAELRRIIQP
jgi:tetratricopeptide (TPR) repeat protein